MKYWIAFAVFCVLFMYALGGWFASWAWRFQRYVYKQIVLRDVEHGRRN